MSTVFVDSLDITVADSFVVRENKTRTGNGEAKLYVGSRISPSYRTFFGAPGFRIKCRLRKSDLQKFLENMRSEYENPSHPYRAKKSLDKIWITRKNSVDSLTTEFNYFYAKEQQHLQSTRGYINSSDDTYKFLRELPLPITSRIKILKVIENGDLIYEFRLIPDTSIQSATPVEIELQEEIARISRGKRKKISKVLVTTVERLTKVRVGQGRFRRDVLDDCGSICPFTNVTDESLLIAGHLKRWEHATPAEQLDPQNGLIFTPTYDRLVNDGLISFQDDGKLMISPLLSKETCKRLALKENMQVKIPITGRKNAARRIFLKHHREHVFRS